MAAIKQLAAVTRSGIGKGAARSVRREGRVPGVVYGGGETAEPISVDFKELNKFIYSGHFLTSIFEIDIEGRKQRVLPRDYQLDKVTDAPVHVDFFRLKAGTRVRIAVPVHVVSGSVDRVAPKAAVLALSARLRGPDVRYREMGKPAGDRADYGHGDLLVGRSAPEEVFPVLLDFLEAVD